MSVQRGLSGELEAGRELDALVAEKVMGFEVDRQNVAPSLGYDVVCYSDQIDEGAMVCSYYSATIAAAWPVVEKLHADGWVWGINSKMAGGWYVNLWHRPPDGPWGETCTVHADTLPEAICRAALKAVEATPTKSTD